MTAVAVAEPDAVSSTGSSTSVADSAAIAPAAMKPSSASIPLSRPTRLRISSTIASVIGGYMAKYSQSASDGIGSSSSFSWITHQTSPASQNASPAAISSHATQPSRTARPRHAASATQPAITPS